MVNDNNETFEQYLSGILSDEEKKRFDMRLHEDISFANDFKLFNLSVYGLQKTSKQDDFAFEDAMKNISIDSLLQIIGEDKGRIVSTNHLTINWKTIVSIAAVLIIGWAGIGEYYNYQSDLKVDDATFSAYYSSDEVGLSRGTQNVDFEKALSLLENKKYSEAIPLLESVYKSADTQMKGIAGWYLSLSYIKSHERSKAKEILQALQDLKIQDSRIDNLLNIIK